MFWSTAAPVELSRAQALALTFWNQSGCATRSGNASTDFIEVSSQAGFQNLYIFVNASGRGFVVMSADDVVRPVLAYSETGRFDAAALPSNAAYWLSGYDRAIGNAVANQIVPSEEVTSAWATLASGNVPAPKSTTSVNPLLTTSWDQGYPYNALCPGSDYEKAPTGCTATAMAQVMKYWSYPPKGMGSHSYVCSYYTQTLSADFGATTYNWSDMPDEPYSSNSAVATLMYHCGVSMEMNYTPSASGAHMISYHNATSNCAEVALKKYFGYSSRLHGEEKDDFTDDQWIAMLKAELDAGRPVPYSGIDVAASVGHSFVCDGYDGDDQFHINWGWSGNCDGYFTINALMPNGTGWGGGGDDYSTGQCAIFGAEPPQLRATNHSSTTMTSANGGYIVNHGAPLSFTANIKAAAAFNGSVRLVILKSNGIAVEQEIGSPISVTIGANQISTQTFTTDVVRAYPGSYFLAVQYQPSGSSDWTTVGIDGCAIPVDLTVVLNPDSYEVNNTVGTAYVLPVNFSQNRAVVQTTGSNFHSDEDDYDYYRFTLPEGYHYRISSRVHDVELSGNNRAYTADVRFNVSVNESAWGTLVEDIAPEYELQNGGPVVFKVRTSATAPIGTYLLDIEIVRTVNSGVGEASEEPLFTLYPSPVTDHLHFEMSPENVTAQSYFQILDVFGRLVKQEPVTSADFVADVSGLDSGLYFVRFVADGQVLATKKFVKR